LSTPKPPWPRPAPDADRGVPAATTYEAPAREHILSWGFSLERGDGNECTASSNAANLSTVRALIAHEDVLIFGKPGPDPRGAAHE
jgi:hypothetical protein